MLVLHSSVDSLLFTAALRGVSLLAIAGIGAPAAAQGDDVLMPLIHMEANLPAYRLDVFLRHERVRVYRVAIGRRDFRTPRGSFEISRLEWNPWWVPPKSASAKSERVTPPGPDNPMGKVRFPFRPSSAVHGTPAERSIGTAASRGYIRLSNADAVDLATLLQYNLLGKVANDSLLRAAMPARRTLAVKLPHSVPLDVRYDLAEVLADTLFLYPDPYQLGVSPARSALEALEASGLDTTAVEFARIRAMPRYPAAIPAAFAIRRRPWP